VNFNTAIETGFKLVVVLLAVVFLIILTVIMVRVVDSQELSTVPEVRLLDAGDGWFTIQVRSDSESTPDPVPPVVVPPPDPEPPEPIPPSPTVPGTVVITEVMYDQEVEEPEFVEIYCVQGPCDLSGFRISDTDRLVYPIPNNIILETAGILLIQTGDGTNQSNHLYTGTGYFLERTGDEIQLLNPDRECVDAVVFEIAQDEVSCDWTGPNASNEGVRGMSISRKSLVDTDSGEDWEASEATPMEFLGQVPPPGTTGSAQIAWNAPTQWSDGSPLTVDSYVVYHRASAGSCDAPDRRTTDSTQLVWSDLSPGRHFFSIIAVSAGVNSECSVEVSKDIQ